MPLGLSRFTAPVVSIAALMPLTGASGQVAVARPAPGDLVIVQVADGFVIRSAIAQRTHPILIRLGTSIRLDRALLGRPTPFHSPQNQGGRDAVR